MASKILPVIMCGGAGTRVWPESRETMPKQFIALIGERSTFQDTMQRVTGPVFEAPIVITNHDYRFLVKEQLAEIGVEATIVTEPIRRDSGPAVAVAAALAARRSPETVVAVFASDHVITKQQAFLEVCAAAAAAAETGYIVTLGVKPTEPAIGYGYIRPGARFPARGLQGRGFRRKARARDRRALCRGRLSLELRQFLLPRRRDARGTARIRAGDVRPPQAPRSARRKTDLGFLALDARAFGEAPKKSIDYAVMERTKRAAVVPADIGWSDVGNWDAVWKLTDRDASGNSIYGEGVAMASDNVHVRSTGLLTAAVGVKDVIVVTTQDAVLVIGRDQGDKVKDLVEHLRKTGRREAVEHKRMYRPWGYYQSVDQGAATRSSASSSRPASACRCRSTTTAPSTGSSSRERRR